jgi:heat-inducible transcriptional repressor
MSTAPSLDERRALVLRAIVSHYVSTGEPVGSKTLVERFKIPVSAATVRNDMGALEETGYIYQPHTSAGRIPTDAGYRHFVDTYSSDARLPESDARRVRQFFGEPRWELEDSLRQTASLLSKLTDHAAVIFAPVLERSTVRKIELVRLTGDRAMVIVVTDTGRVENHVVHIPESVDEVQLSLATEMLNKIGTGVVIENVASEIRAALDRFPLELRPAVEPVVHVLAEEITDAEGERVFLEGASTIVDEAKFADLETVRGVISALEHRRLLLEVMAEALSSGSVSVRIGSENSVAEMQRCTVITAPYGVEGSLLGSLGIVGPTRMDYARTIGAVYEVSSQLGRMLTDLGL